MKDAENTELKPAAADSMPAGPLISVIVPVYNVEQYLRRSLDSICNQSYRDIEVICVDDGSTDGSLAILREYESKDSRVRVISKPNGGVSSARNAGLEAVRGVWVAWVDPDDYLMPEAYSKLVPLMAPELDSIVYGTKVEAPPSLESKVAFTTQRLRLPGEGPRRLDAEFLPDDNNYLWSRIYRYSIIREHHVYFDPEVNFGEDLCWNQRFCAYARQLYFYPEPLYVYCLREGSTVYGDRSGWVGAFMKVFDNILSTYQRQGMISDVVPRILYLVKKMQPEINGYSVRYMPLMQTHAKFLEMLRRYRLEREPGLLPTIHRMEEQHRRAVRLIETLKAAFSPCVETEDSVPGELHLAIPTNEMSAGLAVLLAQSVREHAGANSALCVHFICDGISPCTKERMLRLALPGLLRVRVHEGDSALLRTLPGMDRSSHLWYLKVALPCVLPQVKRVLMLEPGLLIRGDLPDLNAWDMDGQPVAVSLDWPYHVRRQHWFNNCVEVCVPDVMALMDLELMRERQDVDSWLAISQLTPWPLKKVDENSFNALFNNRKAFLPDVLSWLSEAKPASMELRAYHVASPWADFPLDMKWPASVVASPQPAAAPPPPEPSAAQVMLGRYGALRRRYRYYSIMSKLTWGKRRKRYKARRNSVKQLLREMRELGRKALAPYGLGW